MDIQVVKSADLFTTGLRNSDMVKEVCDATPRVFVTDQEPFKSHFTASCGVITRRDYSWNPYVGDLWYLHELRHMQLLARSRDKRGVGAAIPWAQWRAERISQEFDASFWTEALVYLRNPWLREKTFPFEIWIDRILRDPRLYEHLMPGGIEDYARWKRWEVIQRRTPDDFQEEQIVNYHAQNTFWVTLWARHAHSRDGQTLPVFRAVEERMVVKPPRTILDHLRWLEGWSTKVDYQGEDITFPFAEVGQLFHDEYRRTADRYGNALLMA